MLSSNDIRDIKFSKSVGGYKQEEVDIILDEIESDYEQYERILRELTDKVDVLNKQIDGYKETQSSIQSVLLSAQKLADQIVEDAKMKSEDILNKAEANLSIITAREKELSNAFELKASERKAAAEAEINAMLSDAKRKADAIEKATEASVKRQQMLFDRLKLEVSNFKSDITGKYKEHLELLQKIPDVASIDPAHIAETTAEKFSVSSITKKDSDISSKTIENVSVDPIVIKEPEKTDKEETPVFQFPKNDMVTQKDIEPNEEVNIEENFEELFSDGFSVTDLEL